MNTLEKGGFTLPGEAGYEQLTLQLCKQWGADCIRDSDGTKLSGEILGSGIPIYSTLCLVRSVNAWARANRDKLQRNFLVTEPVLATSDTLIIDPLDGFSRDQFALCESDDPYEFWQVYDRTTGEIHVAWRVENGRVIIENALPYHLYTVSFLALRQWEEISMYNHITNDWGDRERLMAVEPRYPETQKALLDFLETWLNDHPHTSVVRFTSLFYNFAWFWGSDPKRRDVFSDWGSYDFAVNPISLREFEKAYGYRLTAEDFVNGGLYRPTHNPPTKKQRDWMEFTGAFVREFGKRCVDVVHRHGKKAYVFYDDSWIGLEPWNGHFEEFGFDGLIKCVFSAFEARLCAGAPVKTHELRLHPYLFPTGLSGEPTFAPGGRPERDARMYWLRVRRALLRVKIDRIGLGGYLHLTEPFPEFQEEITRIADEFRALRALHEGGAPLKSDVKIAVIQSWGGIRTWNCAGHMHEHPELPLNHLYESLAGLPFELTCLSLEDIAKNGVPEGVDVLINAGREGDAWSGGDIWREARLTAAITAFVARGGGLIGVGEPSACRGGARFFRLADVLGVDREIGQSVCKGKYKFDETPNDLGGDEEIFHNHTKGVYALGGQTEVLRAHGGDVALSRRAFFGGRAVYLSGYTYGVENTLMLRKIILWAARRDKDAYVSDCADCECAYFPAQKKLAVLNSGERDITANIQTPRGDVAVSLPPRGMKILSI